jgi:putative phosphoesterase
MRPPADGWLGLISDTHGLLRHEALELLRGAERILHAGDLGKPQILERLATLAPVTAVRGNIDGGAWARDLPASAVVRWGRQVIYMIHDLAALDLDPAAAGFAAVIHGHSHEPSIEERGGVLYVNPGSAGPKRFHLPVTVARLRVVGEGLSAEIVQLEV